MTASHTITHHDHHIQVVIHENFDVKAEALTMADKLYNALESRSGTVFMTIEVASIKWGFNDIMVAVNLSAKGGNAYLHHPNLKQFILITSIKGLEIVLKSLDNPMFGNVKSKAFASYQQAIDYIEHQSQQDRETKSPA